MPTKPAESEYLKTVLRREAALKRMLSTPHKPIGKHNPPHKGEGQDRVRGAEVLKHKRTHFGPIGAARDHSISLRAIA